MIDLQKLETLAIYSIKNCSIPAEFMSIGVTIYPSSGKLIIHKEDPNNSAKYGILYRNLPDSKLPDTYYTLICAGQPDFIGMSRFSKTIVYWQKISTDESLIVHLVFFITIPANSANPFFVHQWLKSGFKFLVAIVQLDQCTTKYEYRQHGRFEAIREFVNTNNENY